MMGSEEYTWKITNNTIPSISTLCQSSISTNFSSETFELCKFNWQIEIYPNGYAEDSKGYFKVYVQLKSDLPENAKNIIILRTIQCEESMSKVTNICAYKRQEAFGWITGSLCLKEVIDQKYESLTFIVTIQVLQINLKDDQKLPIINPIHLENSYRSQYQFTWSLTGKLIIRQNPIIIIFDPIHLQNGIISALFFRQIAIIPTENGNDKISESHHFSVEVYHSKQS